jgi:basic membrane protein A
LGTGGEGLRRQAELTRAKRLLAMPRIIGVLFGSPGAGSFNEAGARAFAAVQDAGTPIEVHWVAPSDAADRAAALAQLCATRADLLIAHGGQGDAPVAAIAGAHPNVVFAITQGAYLAPNVACYEVLQEESAFLAGILAARMTATGVVAHLSGERVRPGLKGRAAFAHGVRTADPGVRLLTTFCGNQHDAALSARVVDAQADAGADYLFAMIDGGRAGAIDACRRRGVAQIGNVLDWTRREPDVFVASALADSGWGIQAAVQDFLAGKLASGTKRTAGVEAPDIVDLLLAPRVPATVREEIARYRQALREHQLSIDDEYGGPEFEPGAPRDRS